MDLEEIGINTGNWVDSAQDRDYWRALLNVTLNLPHHTTVSSVFLHSYCLSFVPTLLLHKSTSLCGPPELWYINISLWMPAGVPLQLLDASTCTTGARRCSRTSSRRSTITGAYFGRQGGVLSKWDAWTKCGRRFLHRIDDGMTDSTTQTGTCPIIPELNFKKHNIFIH